MILKFEDALLKHLRKSFTLQMSTTAAPKGSDFAGMLSLTVYFLGVCIFTGTVMLPKPPDRY